MNERYNVTVLDMQPIDPPTGGGRIRLLGLYHNLGDNLSTTYVGTYDWEGEKYRDHYLSQTFREINVPLSKEHFKEIKDLQNKVNGKTIIDVTFHKYANLSEDYVKAAAEWVLKSDIVIFSHPWVYPLVKGALKKDKQLIVYDSHNVEGYLRYNLLGGGETETNIVREVVKMEYELSHFADIVLTCSHEDRELFNKLYEVPFDKIKVVPNGVFTEEIKPVDSKQKNIIKQELGLPEKITAIFVASNYPPNVEAANYIVTVLAPKLPDVFFLIAGGVGEALKSNQQNVLVTGRLTEDEKIKHLSAADIAINPMFSGSGTNIKMFDFMAAGLPIVSTDTGARGITGESYAGIVISNKSNFAIDIRNIISKPEQMVVSGYANRSESERKYAWEKISPKLGKLIYKEIIKKRSTADSVGVNKSKKHKVALMSSWNVRCGIAEYSRFLVHSLESKNIDLLIIGNANSDLKSCYLVDDITQNIHHLWLYDNIMWKDSKINIEGIVNLLLEEGIPNFIIQYHRGFFSQLMLMALVKSCIKATIKVCVTMHNSREIPNDYFVEMNNLGITIFVHSLDEKERLDHLGIKNVFHVPLGIADFQDEDVNSVRRRLRISGSPVIGSFGFLRPHKGVAELIEAIGILKNQYHDILFLGVHALYPSHDSREYLKQCNQLMNKFNISDNVIMLTDFLDIEQVISYLHACDIVVLPYHESKEGASGVAASAFAAKRPLIISNSSIFNGIKNLCYCVNTIQPKALATEIHHVISSPELLHQITDNIVKYAEENSFTKIADQYVENFIKRDKKIDYEMLVQKVYESVLENGDTAIDVGAHIGRHTIPIARKVYPKGKVYAFEPLSECRKSMLASLKKESPELLSIISLYPFAISNYEGESEFTVAIDSLGYSGLKERSYDNETRISKIPVTVKKLDTILSGVHSVKYIKIDAEGGEFDIIKGSAHILKAFRPLVTFEFGLSSYAKYSVIPEDVFKFWHENHYQIYDILGNSLNRERVFVDSTITQKLWDYIAIPEEKTVLTNNVIRTIKSILKENEYS